MGAARDRGGGCSRVDFGCKMAQMVARGWLGERLLPALPAPVIPKPTAL